MNAAAIVLAAEYKTPPADVTGNVTIYLGWALWLLTLLAVGRLVWIGGKFGWHRWTGTPDDNEPVIEIIGLIIGAILAGTAGTWALVMVGR